MTTIEMARSAIRANISDPTGDGGGLDAIMMGALRVTCHLSAGDLMVEWIRDVVWYATNGFAREGGWWS